MGPVLENQWGRQYVGYFYFLFRLYIFFYFFEFQLLADFHFSAEIQYTTWYDRNESDMIDI